MMIVGVIKFINVAVKVINVIVVVKVINVTVVVIG